MYEYQKANQLHLIEGPRRVYYNKYQIFFLFLSGRDLIFEGGCQTATRFNIPNFDNPFSYYRPNDYITNSSFLLTLITINFAFRQPKLIQLILINNELINIINKKISNFGRNKSLKILNTISADEYQYSSKRLQIQRLVKKCNWSRDPTKHQ